MDGHGQRVTQGGPTRARPAPGRPAAPVVATGTLAVGAVAVIVFLGITLADPGTAPSTVSATASLPVVEAGTDAEAQWWPLPVTHHDVRPVQRHDPARIAPPVTRPVVVPSPAAPGAAVVIVPVAPDIAVAIPSGSAPTVTTVPAPPTSPVAGGLPAATATPASRATSHQLLPPVRRHLAVPERPRRPTQLATPAPSPSATTAPTTASTRTATDAEQVGVVDVTTVLDFGAGEAAGTGIVLPSGQILTNNHVIRDATQIRVTVVATGASSVATVVGTDPTADIAVLTVAGGAGPAATLATGTTSVAVADTVVPVGNAGGRGGTPTAAPGTVVALDQDITASDDVTGANAEHLAGLIAFSAAIEPGDSGGPLYDQGAVVGIDTAAAVSRRSQSGRATVGYAIPISTATSISARILAGEQSTTVHQGLPAFLGVEVAENGRAMDGARIVDVVANSPGAAAGLGAGDTITAIDGTSVDDPAALATLLATHRPEDQVTIRWTDSRDAVQVATVVLTAGPAI